MRFNTTSDVSASGSKPKPRIPSIAECSSHAVEEGFGLGFHHSINGRPKDSVNLRWDLDHPSMIAEYLRWRPVYKLWRCRHVVYDDVRYIIMDCSWDGDFDTPANYEDMEWLAVNRRETFCFTESDFCDQDYFFFEAL